MNARLAIDIFYIQSTQKVPYQVFLFSERKQILQSQTLCLEALEAP